MQEVKTTPLDVLPSAVGCVYPARRARGRRRQMIVLFIWDRGALW